jgi:hypothetical protein
MPNIPRSWRDNEAVRQTLPDKTTSVLGLGVVIPVMEYGYA